MILFDDNHLPVSGIPAMSMCNANCTWADKLVVDLYPWDAGTDEGTRYVVRGSTYLPQFLSLCACNSLSISVCISWPRSLELCPLVYLSHWVCLLVRLLFSRREDHY